MPMENQLAHAITQTEYDSSYDKAAKKLLANKQILAQIMKNCVNEYSACSVDEIAEKYIEGTPEVGTVGVHVDDTNRPKKTSDVIVGSNNEDSTLTEGTINYDVRFDAIAPASEGSTAQKDVIRLIINVEAQTADKASNLLLQQDDLRTAWSDIHELGVWENPKSVLYLGLYTPNQGVPKHSDSLFYPTRAVDWKRC